MLANRPLSKQQTIATLNRTHLNKTYKLATKINNLN